MTLNCIIIETLLIFIRLYIIYLILCIQTPQILGFNKQKGEIMETLTLSKLVSNTSLNTEGFALYCILEKYFEKNHSLTLDLMTASAISSSFFNSSFGALIEKYGYPRFKESIKFKNVSKSQAQLLKLYFDSFRNLEHN